MQLNRYRDEADQSVPILPRTLETGRLKQGLSVLKISCAWQATLSLGFVRWQKGIACYEKEMRRGFEMTKSSAGVDHARLNEINKGKDS